MKQLYINLPVADLPKATAFYEALGFVKNPYFSNDQASALLLDGITLMLLIYEFYQTFLPPHKKIANSHQTSQVLNALQCETKEIVDMLFDRALAAGAKKTIPTYDHGFMYGRDFEDLDGHIWEVFWMDASQIPPS